MAVSMLYPTAVFFVKISFLLMFLRIFGSSRTFKWATYAIAFFVFGCCFAGFVASIFSCTPIRRYWDPVNTPGTCIDLVLFGIVGSSLNILADFLILLLPVRAVWKLKLPTKQKIILLGIFTLGSL